jgi:hypothetical protein
VNLVRRLLIVTQCECHRWIEDGIERSMRGGSVCGRCRKKTEFVREAEPGDKTECLHEGECTRKAP